MKEKIRIEPAARDDLSIVQNIFEACPGYFRNTAKSVVKPHFAENALSDGPAKEKQSPTYKKVFCLIYLDDKPFGVVDFHKDHSAAGSAYIGLLLIEEKFHGRGLGRACYLAAESYAKTALGAQKIVLGISEDNDVEKFWEKLGFARNGRTYVWESEGHKNKVFEMEKLIN